MTEVESSDLSRYSFGGSEFRGLSNLEKAVLLCCAKKMTIIEAAAFWGVTKSAVGRGCIAWRENRDVGKSGQPGLLNRDETTRYIELVNAHLDTGTDMSFEVAINLVSFEFLNRKLYILTEFKAEATWVTTPGQNLAIPVPNFTRKWVNEVFAKHDIVMRKPRLVEQVCSYR